MSATLFDVKTKRDEEERTKAEEPETKYDFGPGECIEKGYVSLWQVGVPPKQAKRGCVWTNINGFIEMGRKGFLTGEALAVYRRVGKEPTE